MTEYYVDNSKTAAGDGSKNKPWNNVNRHLRDLRPGDTMYLRGGKTKMTAQTYTETVDIRSANGCANGTSIAPITIQNYPNEYIVFSGQGDTDVFDVDREYWILDGTGVDGEGNYYFEIDKGSYDGDFGIDLDGDHNTIRYLEMHSGAEFMVDVSGDHNTIEYCKIYDMYAGAHKDAHGIFGRLTTSYGTVDNCEIYDCHGNTIQFLNDSTEKYGWTFSNNHLYMSVPGPGYDSVAGFKAGKEFVFRDNVLHGARDNDGTSGATGGDGRGLTTWADCEDWEIFNNEIYDCSGQSLYIRGTNMVIHHNVVRDPTYEASISEKTVIYIISGSTNLHNNTVIGNLGPGTNVMRFLSGTTVDVKNNIFKDTEEIQDDGATLAYDCNCWRNCSQTLSGANDVTDDAQFVNEAGADYRLQATSPCINAGVDLGYPYHGSHPDMGAHEYDDGAAPVGTGPVPTDVERILNELEAKLGELRELVLSN